MRKTQPSFSQLMLIHMLWGPLFSLIHMHEHMHMHIHTLLENAKNLSWQQIIKRKWILNIKLNNISHCLAAARWYQTNYKLALKGSSGFPPLQGDGCLKQCKQQCCWICSSTYFLKVKQPDLLTVHVYTRSHKYREVRKNKSVCQHAFCLHPLNIIYCSHSVGEHHVIKGSQLCQVLVPQRGLTHVLNILALIIEGYALYFNDNSLSVYRWDTGECIPASSVGFWCRETGQ